MAAAMPLDAIAPIYPKGDSACVFLPFALRRGGVKSFLWSER